MTAVDAKALIDTIDLAYPVEQAEEEASALSLPFDKVEAETCYRTFLYVCWFTFSRRGSLRAAAICECADAVWHQHILLTRKYREDCEKLFGAGRFLDHEPSDYAEAGRAAETMTAGAQAAARQLYSLAGADVCPRNRANCAWCTVP